MLYVTAITACIVLAFTGSAWLSVVAILTLRISFTLFQPLQTELQNKQVLTKNRATALSINAVIIDSMGVGTNVAFGTLAERNLTGALLMGAGCAQSGQFYLQHGIKTVTS